MLEILKFILILSIDFIVVNLISKQKEYVISLVVIFYI